MACRGDVPGIGGVSQRLLRLAGAGGERAAENGRLDAAIGEQYGRSKGRSGSRKIHRSLKKQGWQVSHQRVARCMRQLGLQAIVHRRFRACTTDSRHDQPVAPNLLERCFTVAGPNQVWVGDITNLPTQQGWVYLEILYDRERLHSTLGYLTPEQFEQLTPQLCA